MTLRVNNKLWIISDTHFGHKNIIKFQQRPESHEAIMLSEWIWAVPEEDQILHMGDVFLGKQGNPNRWAAIIRRLPGQKFLIKGNHDKQSDAIYEQAGFTIVKPFVHNGFAFTHRPITPYFPLSAPEGAYQAAARARILQGAPLPPDPGDGWHTNIHGHVHGNSQHPDDGSLLSDKRYINVCVEVMNYKPLRLGNIWN